LTPKVKMWGGGGNPTHLPSSMLLQWVKLWCMDQSCAILVGEKIIEKQKIELHHHLRQLQHMMKKIDGRKFTRTLKM
jgi:hypothetical protein